MRTTGEEIFLSIRRASWEDCGAENKTRLKDGRRNNFTLDTVIVLMIEHSFEPENLFLI